jgi:MFS family permease
MIASQTAPAIVPLKPDPSFGWRWTALAALSLTLFGCYYAFDSVGPLAAVLSRQLHFSNYDIGLLQASYSLPNIVGILVAGIIIDRIGARKSMLIFAAIIFSGLVVTALTPRVVIMASGRLFVGFGSEALAMASHVAIARWFARSELGLAFALRGSASRLGSVTAQTSPTWIAAAYAYWRWPLFISVGFGLCCLFGTALYWLLDSRGEERFNLGQDGHKEKFVLRDIWRFNRSFWLLAAICITFYSCTFPFQTFGQKFFIDTRHATSQTASLLVGMEPLFSLFLMPVFGYLADRHGKRALLMAVGSILLVPVFLLLAYTRIPPAIPMALMGIAFALVPSVLWMSIVFVVDRSRLGFASAVVDAIQQLGLVGANLLIGWSNDHWYANLLHPAGYRPSMWIFTVFALLAVTFAITLRQVETGPRAHGLETFCFQR